MIRYLLLLLLPLSLLAQGPGRTFQYAVKPTDGVKPSNFNSYDIYADTVAGKTYKYVSGKWIENLGLRKAFKGDQGIQGPIGPQGQAGVCPPCPGGGTGVLPWIVLSTTAVDDYTLLQAAINEQKLSGKEIRIIGELKVSNGVRFSKTHKRPTIIGGIITTTNNNPYAVIGSDFPTSTADAEFYVERIYEIRNLTINCQSNQIGIAPGPNKGSIFESNLINGGASGLYNRFALNGTVNRCEFLGQAYPTVTAHGGTLPLPGILANYGSWGDASVANSCSNVFTFNHSRVYSNGNTIWANSCFASDGVYYYDCINEGHKIVIDYRIDALSSTTAKRWGVIRSHHESVVALTDQINEAMVYCRAPSGQLEVENPLGHYAAIMVNAGGTVGTLNVTVRYNQWWVPVSGKWWYNASAGGNTAWQIKYIENLGSDPAIIPGLFAGTPVRVVASSQVNPGNNSVTFEPIPR